MYIYLSIYEHEYILHTTLVCHGVYPTIRVNLLLSLSLSKAHVPPSLCLSRPFVSHHSHSRLQ
jgi:hypothetical protein